MAENFILRLFENRNMEVSTQHLMLLALSLALCILHINAKKLTEANEENCEVCVKFVSRFIDSLESDVKSDPKRIEEEFRKTCKKTKKDDNRFCYYVGGLEESATGMLGELSKPLAWGVPADKICMKLYRQDAQICDLRYDKTIDFATVNLKKLKVGDLKGILSDWNEQCRGCTEKSDFIQLIEELIPKYAPDAAVKRAAMKSEL